MRALRTAIGPLQRRPFELGPLLEEAADETRLRTTGVHVAVRVDPAGATADGDPARVHQVVTNLLDNAVRHSPAGGTVEVRATRTRAAVTIEVCDEGPGIREEDKQMVFERFYRADSARSSKDGGAGLGLAIARWIVDLHGGDIRVETRQPQGCRMVVVLPVAGAR